MTDRAKYQRERAAAIAAGTWIVKTGRGVKVVCACGADAVCKGQCRICYNRGYNDLARGRGPKQQRERPPLTTQVGRLRRQMDALRRDVAILHAMLWGEP